MDSFVYYDNMGTSTITSTALALPWCPRRAPYYTVLVDRTATVH